MKNKIVKNKKNQNHYGYDFLSDFILIMMASIESYLLFIIVNESAHFFTLFLVHLPLCLILMVIWWLFQVSQNNSSLRLMLVILSVSLGPIGCWSALILRLKHGFSSDKKNFFMQWYAELIKDIDDEAESKNIRLGRHSVNQRAHIDVLQNGSSSEKCHVLKDISQRYNPGFARLLNIAKKDKDASVSVLASTVVAKLEDDYFIKEQNLLEKIKKNIDKDKHLLELANHYEMLVDSEFATNERARICLSSALKCIKSLVQIHSQKRIYRIRLARLSYRLEDIQTAAEQMIIARKQGGFDEHEIQLHLDILFKSKQYELIRQYCSADVIDFQDHLDPNYVAAISLWRSGVEQ